MATTIFEKPMGTDLYNKVNISDIANNLTTDTAGKVLDARQGKALAEQMANLISSGNDYIKFPDGTMIEWETSTTINKSTTSIVFSVPFISVPTVTVSGGAGGTRTPLYIEDVVKTGFSIIRTDSASSSTWYRWIAIGKWK